MAPVFRYPVRRRGKDEGSALLIVIGTMTVLTIFVSVALTYALKTTSYVTRTSGWNQALAAAEAGVDDYLARLNANDNYWQARDCTNVAMRDARYATACPSWAGTVVGWSSVPGSAARAAFHYDPVTTKTPVEGTILLTSTGRVDKITRTVQVTLRRGGFGEFLYHSVYETIDPANESVYGYNNQQALDRCTHYAWDPVRPRPDAAGGPPDLCQDIQFGTGDKLDGPVHSNDAILTSGTPWFQGAVTTSLPACKPVGAVLPPQSRCYRRASGVSGLPRFDKGISYQPEIELPASIGDLLQFVDPARTPAADLGCRYTGPTRIKFLPTASGAEPTMQVWSPWSRTTLNPGCGNHNGTWPQTIPVPTGKLILVRGVPASQGLPSSGACSAGSIGGYPQAGDYNQTLSESDCRYGTVYLEGPLNGRVTVAAENNILITGNVTYAGGTNGSDALGLIAANSVKIYHPVARQCVYYFFGNCYSYSNDYENMAGPGGTMFRDPVVHGSVLTLNHSFTVQEYDVGDPLGTLTLYGSLAQKFRGPVARSGSYGVTSGYLKNYLYDARLRYAPPPFFLDPVRSSWGTKTFGEVSALYR